MNAPPPVPGMAKAKGYLIAFVIGAIMVVSSTGVFLLVTNKQLTLRGEWDAYLVQTLIASLPFILLAWKGVVDRMVWFLGVVLTATFWGNFALVGIRYQLGDAKGGVDFGAVFLLFISPVIISPICFIAANIRSNGFRGVMTNFMALPIWRKAVYGFGLLLLCFILLQIPISFLGSENKSVGEKIVVDVESCRLERTAHSISGGAATQLNFANMSGETIKVYWLTYAGKRKLYRTLRPGQSHTQQTGVGHPWVVTNADEVCVRLYFPSLQTKKIVIK